MSLVDKLKRILGIKKYFYEMHSNSTPIFLDNIPNRDRYRHETAVMQSIHFSFGPSTIPQIGYATMWNIEAKHPVEALEKILNNCRTKKGLFSIVLSEASNKSPRQIVARYLSPEATKIAERPNGILERVPNDIYELREDGLYVSGKKVSDYAEA